MNTTKNINLSSYIEHTLLKPDTVQSQIIKLCEEAMKFCFKGVCVNSHFVPLAHSLLKNSSSLLVSVIGFPLGACLSKAKAVEAQLAQECGAQEIDMVINIGAVKDNLWSFVSEDIRTVTKAVSIPVKVILETGFLTNDEIVAACKSAEDGGALFVKTCTGFAPGAATVEHVKLMRASVSSHIQVKASGGIKTPEQAMALIAAGASRLGTSSGVQLVTNQVISPQSY